MDVDGKPCGPQSASAGKVTIVSQNMWNSFYAGGPQREKRLEAFRKLLETQGKAVEILVLQEMFAFGLGPFCDKSEVELLQEWTTDLGFVHQTSPLVTMPWLGQSSGLLICSKEPILSEQHHVFQQRRRVTSKGWLEVEVQLASMKLVIITTHLEHAHSPHWRRIRESQWREIAERLKVLKDDYVILLGDFNVCGEDFGRALDGAEEYHALLSSMARAGFSHEGFPRSSGSEMPTLRPQNDVSLRSSPDHIFVSPKLKHRSLTVALWDMDHLEQIHSDHRAIMATFNGSNAT